MGNPNPFNHADTFADMAQLVLDWLRGVRTSELERALDLIGQELKRRGCALTWAITPPLTEENRSK